VSIKDELTAELRDAMRAGDATRRDAIRQVMTEVSVKAAEPGFTGEPDDDTYLSVLTSYVKKLEKSAEEYRSLGERGATMAEKLGGEITYLSRWLPARLGEEETRALVAQALEDLGADDAKAAGQVIGHIMKTHRDLVDGRLVGRLVNEALAEE
jgi:hypothetical protein